jgi:hypothetical protein
MNFEPSVWNAPTTDNGNAYRWITANSGANTLITTVNVPSGVTITGIGLNYCDSNPAGDWTLILYDSFGDGLFNIVGTLAPTDRVGCGYAFSTPLTYNYDANQGHILSLYLFQPAIFDGSVSFRGAEVYYKLRVSPAPVTATFSDVPTSHPFHRFIEALAASGITAGCGGGQFCPNAPITRGEMAVFLSAALGLHFPN